MERVDEFINCNSSLRHGSGQEFVICGLDTPCENLTGLPFGTVSESRTVSTSLDHQQKLKLFSWRSHCFQAMAQFDAARICRVADVVYETLSAFAQFGAQVFSDLGASSNAMTEPTNPPTKIPIKSQTFFAWVFLLSGNIIGIETKP